jgi:phosphate transport system protein
VSVTRIKYIQELETLTHRLVEMGADVDSMIAGAMEALMEQDIAKAEAVIVSDDTVDDLDLLIETECMRLIALQQPLARDLRLIGTTFKVITDLERIGDHAVDIAKVARKLAHNIFFEPLVDLPKMARSVRQMLKDAMNALVDHDLLLVEKVVLDDDAIDTLFHQIRDECHTAMRRDPALVVQASYLLFVAHYLERMADHIVNIAERIYYVETGDLAQLAKSHKTLS